MKTLIPSAKLKPTNGKAGIKSKQNGSVRFDAFAAIAGKARDLPDDMAANHDYYLHGTSKQQPRRGRWIPTGKALRRPTLAQVAAFNHKMEKLAAEIEGLPPDLAKNLDHYLHGHPKI